MGKEQIVDYVMNSPENTNPAILRQIIDENSGAGLPEVTADDNGDVLTVVEGEWAKASPSSDGILIVTFTDVEAGAVIADVTVGTILSAYNAGTVVIGRYLDESLNEPVEYNMLAEATPYEGEITAFRFYKIIIGDVMNNIPIKTYEILMETQDETDNYGTLTTNTFNAEFASN